MAPQTTGRERKAAAGRKQASSPKTSTGSKTPKAKDGAGRPAKGKRRSSPPAVELDDDVLEFIDALDRFKKAHDKPFPSWSEVLHVLRSLGYRKSQSD